MFYFCEAQGLANACDADALASCEMLNASLDPIEVYCANNDPRGTAEVGSKHRPNAWGVHDSLGNVQEWVWDRAAADYGGHQGMEGAVLDPSGPDEGPHRLFRGGSWLHPAHVLRASSRTRGGPSYRHPVLGFRPARTISR